MKFKKGDVTFDGRYFQFGKGIYQELKKVFSDKDVEEEIRKAERWILYNRAKKDWTRFLCNWLNRANKKKNAPVQESPQSFSKRTASQPKSIQETLQTLFPQHTTK